MIPVNSWSFGEVLSAEMASLSFAIVNIPLTNLGSLSLTYPSYIKKKIENVIFNLLLIHKTT